MYATILVDNRHKRILKLMEKTIDKRNFPDWSTGFKSLTIDEASHLSGYLNLGSDIFKNSNFEQEEHPALKLLKTFHNNARF